MGSTCCKADKDKYETDLKDVGIDRSPPQHTSLCEGMPKLTIHQEEVLKQECFQKKIEQVEAMNHKEGNGVVKYTVKKDDKDCEVYYHGQYENGK
jgi:hypothetical protein